LLPGLNASAHSFDDIASLLSKSFRVIAVSPRGQLPSSVPRTGYALRRRVEDITALLDSLGIRDAILGAHSISGDVITELAARFPERVQGLVYLEAAYFRLREMPSLPAGFFRTLDLSKLGARRVLDLQCSAPEGLSESAVYDLASDWESLESEHAHLGKTAEGVDSSGMASAAISANAVPPKYEAIRAPVMAIYAEHTTRDMSEMAFDIADQSDSVKATYYDWWKKIMSPFWAQQREDFLSAIPNARIVTIRDASHIIYLSHPRLVNSEIVRFANTLPAVPSPR
jgi:pimeloyl-ACP methyl ester carboxylesterase